MYKYLSHLGTSTSGLVSDRHPARDFLGIVGPFNWLVAVFFLGRLDRDEKAPGGIFSLQPNLRKGPCVVEASNISNRDFLGILVHREDKKRVLVFLLIPQRLRSKYVFNDEISRFCIDDRSSFDVFDCYITIVLHC